MSDGARTRDIPDHNRVLYQLSYAHHVSYIPCCRVQSTFWIHGVETELSGPCREGFGLTLSNQNNPFPPEKVVHAQRLDPRRLIVSPAQTKHG